MQLRVFQAVIVPRRARPAQTSGAALLWENAGMAAMPAAVVPTLESSPWAVAPA
jgi:hypothetical protein